MKLEQQVCSLDLAKHLKELGVKQESIYHWFISGTKEPSLVGHTQPATEWFDGEIGYISAFSVAELGEMLGEREPAYFEDGEWKNTGYYDLPEGRVKIVADTEADARAKMLIYLLENKLITI